MRVNEVRDDFRIRLRGKLIALFTELPTHRFVVFNDTVVNHGNAAGYVGVCIELRWRAVGSPTRVRNSERAVNSLRLNQAIELRDPTRAAHALEGTIQDSDTSRVVSPVFQPSQPFDQDRDNVSR